VSHPREAAGSRSTAAALMPHDRELVEEFFPQPLKW
jgi:hypothetical protein